MTTERITRRGFIRTSAAATALATCASATPLVAANSSPPFKISVAPWSLMRKVAGQADPGGIDLWDYPHIVRELGFEGVEHDNLHFPGDLPNNRDIRRMRKACDDQGLPSTLILCGALGDIADADRAARAKAIDNYRAWASAAAVLGCRAIRVVCADRKTELSFDEKRHYAVEGIRSLAEFNATIGLDLLIENHGGYSADPRWLTRVIREVEQPNCGILADFTHWSVQRNPEVNVIDPYEGMKLLAPLTRSVSAHAIKFDGDGNETRWDYYRMVKILSDAAFHGYIAIEYFGDDLSRREGTRKARLLLERVRKRLI